MSKAKPKPQNFCLFPLQIIENKLGKQTPRHIFYQYVEFDTGECSSFPFRGIRSKKEQCHLLPNKGGVSKSVCFASSLKLKKCSRLMSKAIMLLVAATICYLMRGELHRRLNPQTFEAELWLSVLAILLCIPLGVLVSAGVALLEWMLNHRICHQDS